MNQKVLSEIISKKRWDVLISQFTPDFLCNHLSFERAMFLAYDLFYENMHDDKAQEFAVQLAFEIRNAFFDQWNKDWKNDVFLGNMCALTWKYNEQYDCFKRAYDILPDPPDSLLLLLAGCSSAPGVPPITDNEAEGYLKKAIEQRLTYEAALMMRALYQNNQELEKYWSKMCHNLEEKNIHADEIVPDLFLTRSYEA